MLVAGKAERKHGISMWDKPEPHIADDNDVLLEVEACGVCGTDLEIYEWPEDNLPAWMLTLPLPVVLGHETVGRVKETGPAVTMFKPGDRVVHSSTGGCGVCYFCRSGMLNLCPARAGKIPGIMNDGAYAKYAVITDYALFKIPEDISTSDAAVTQPLTVAVHAMERSHMLPGEQVVVIGPGPQGLMQAIMARACGAADVIVSGLDIDRGRLKIAAKLGAIAVDTTNDDLKEKVLDLTGGRGADVVFDCAGGSKTLGIATDVVRKGGEVIVVGVGGTGPFDQNLIMQKEITITGSSGRLPTTWDRTMNLLRSGTISLDYIVSHVMPLKKIGEAFELLHSKEAAKVVITPE